LSDDILNTKIWRLTNQTEKNFGTVAAIVSSILGDSISIEEGLHRIADTFSDSEKEFSTAAKNLGVLEDFINGAEVREKILNYLAVCESSQDEKLEYQRFQLHAVIEESKVNPNKALNEEIENLWQKFHTGFREHFAVKHDMVMKSYFLREKTNEVWQSDEWWEFENLSRLTIFPKMHWTLAQKTYRQLKELDCRFDAQEMLKIQPFCACSFNLTKMRELESLPATLTEIVNYGRRSYRKILRMLSQTLVPLIEQFPTEGNEEFVEARIHLVEIFSKEQEIPLLTNHELVILQKIFDTLPTSPLISVNFLSEEGFLSRDELSLQIGDWLDNLPNEPALLKI